MTRIPTVSLVTLSDPGRLTGGYRYHRRIAELAPAGGATSPFICLPDRVGAENLERVAQPADVLGGDDVAVRLNATAAAPLVSPPSRW